MKFIETKLKGAFIIDLDERVDRRGFFARTFCMKEFIDHGLKPTVAQCNLHAQGDALSNSPSYRN
jgi:dTDP-4-dehydrorhamnose 3,5-epimerase